jgi:purine-binding chemotaxis protein CheW
MDTEHKNPEQPAPALEEAQRLLFVFRNDRQHYAISPIAVVEVMSRLKPTLVPLTADWVEGVISARGEIVPVLDLERYFQLNTLSQEQRNRLVLLEVDNTRFACWAEEIIGIETIEERNLDPPLSTLPDLLLRCTSAQFRYKEFLVQAIDLKKLLESSRSLIKKGSA